jgi:hypothetical protein
MNITNTEKSPATDGALDLLAAMARTRLELAAMDIHHRTLPQTARAPGRIHRRGRGPPPRPRHRARAAHDPPRHAAHRYTARGLILSVEPRMTVAMHPMWHAGVRLTILRNQARGHLMSARVRPTLTAMPETPATLDELRETFARIDENGDGSVSFPEFRSLMHEIGDQRDDISLRTMFGRLDTNNDGRIDFPELRAWLCPP